MTAITALCLELEHAALTRKMSTIVGLIEQLKNEVDQMPESAFEDQATVKPTRIVIADDHPVVRYGVLRMPRDYKEFVVIGEAANGAEPIREIRKLRPDILLLDLNMPSLPGLETLRELTTIEVPTKSILLTSAISPREVLEALQLGSRGVILKDALVDDIRNCITAVVKGNYWINSQEVKNLVLALNQLMEQTKEPPRNTFGLTARQLEIIHLVVQGYSNRDIAEECKLAEETVKSHLRKSFDKLDVSSRLELALFAMNHRIVSEVPAAP